MPAHDVPGAPRGGCFSVAVGALRIGRTGLFIRRHTSGKLVRFERGREREGGTEREIETNKQTEN